jgi:hypothetical protein
MPPDVRVGRTAEIIEQATVQAFPSHFFSNPVAIAVVAAVVTVVVAAVVTVVVAAVVTVVVAAV